MKDRNNVKDNGWKKLLRIILRLVIIGVVASVVLPIVYAIVFFVIITHPILPPLEKSTLNTEIIFNNSALKDWPIIYKGDVMFYKNKNKTILHQIDSGKEVIMSVISPSLFITPENNQYLIIGAFEGKAYLVDKSGLLVKEYNFPPVKVLRGEAKKGSMVIEEDSNPAYTSMGGWLDEHTLFTVNGIFDLTSGQLLLINSPKIKINIDPWEDENRDCRTDPDSIGLCYHIKCLPNSQVFDTTEYDKAPSKSLVERNFCSGCEAKRAYMDKLDVQCLVNGSKESYLIGEKDDPYILVHKNDDKWYGIMVSLPYLWKKVVLNKNISSVWGRTYWNQYPDRTDEILLPNGNKYKLDVSSQPGFDSPVKVLAKLILYNQKGETIGSLSRRDIQLVNSHWHGENKILFLSEKGLETLDY